MVVSPPTSFFPEQCCFFFLDHLFVVVVSLDDVDGGRWHHRGEKEEGDVMGREKPFLPSHRNCVENRRLIFPSLSSPFPSHKMPPPNDHCHPSPLAYCRVATGSTQNFFNKRSAKFATRMLDKASYRAKKKMRKLVKFAQFQKVIDRQVEAFFRKSPENF